jgi:hypothetical protein
VQARRLTHTVLLIAHNSSINAKSPSPSKNLMESVLVLNARNQLDSTLRNWEVEALELLLLELQHLLAMPLDLLNSVCSANVLPILTTPWMFALN